MEGNSKLIIVSSPEEYEQKDFREHLAVFNYIQKELLPPDMDAMIKEDQSDDEDTRMTSR